MKELLQRQAQEKLQHKLQGQQKMATNTGTALQTATTSNSVHTVTNSAQVATGTGPASAPVPLNQHQKTNSSPVGISSSTTATSTASVPLPISTTSLTAHLREQLAKLTPQQRALYMQQLTLQSQKHQQQNQKPPLQQRLVVGAASTAALQTTRAVGNARVSVSPLNSHSTGSPAVKITTQHQQVSVGGVAVKQITRLPNSQASNHLGAGKVVVGASMSPSKGATLRAGFVDVKLAPGAAGKVSSSPTSGKGKGKVKFEKNAGDE